MSKKSFWSRGGHCEKSRSAKKKIYIKYRNDLRKTTPIFGTDEFTSRMDISESRSPVQSHAYTFKMLGNKKHMVCLVSVSTASNEYWASVSSHAAMFADQMLLDVGVDRHAEYRKDGKIDFNKMIRSMCSMSEVTYEKFDNKTYAQIKADCEKSIVQNNHPVVHESISVSRDTHFGLHIKVIVDRPYIDKDVVIEVINKIRQLEFNNYTSPIPVSKENLPTRTFSDQMKYEEVPGYLLGWRVLDLRYKKAKSNPA